jgi:pimeloyl-ACP methyl ester carboxylesterase
MTGLNAADILDPDPARRPGYGRLPAEIWSLLTYRPAPPSPESLPDGAGKPVLVVPAFLTGDSFTRPLREFLTRCGFRPFGWGLGINWGPTPRLLDGLDRRLSDIRRDHGTVALVGVSLGGIFARNLAYERPNDISHVATVASPFRLPTAVNLAPLVRLCARRYSPEVQPARLRQPLPVPATAIYTRTDGIVAWDSCFDANSADLCIELSGAHLTLCSNPETLRVLARQLAEP